MLEPIASAFTFASILASGTLGLAMNEGMGTLMAQDRLHVNPTTGKLMGPFADGAATLAAISGGCSAMYLAIICHHWYHHPNASRLLMALFVLTVVFGMVSATLSLVLVERYGRLTDSAIRTQPAEPATNENFSLQGPFGWANLIVLCITLTAAMSSLAGIIYWRNSKQKL